MSEENNIEGKEEGKKKRYTIEYDRPNCIGAGVCVAVVPENWYFDDDGLASVHKVDIDDDELEDNLAAAEGCPVNVIKIKDNHTGEYLV